MFRFVQDMTHLPVDANRVLAVWRSRSDNMVSLPDCRTQPTGAFLCLVNDPRGGLVAVLALHLKDEDRLVFYRHSAPGESPANLLDEGDRFAESMGFQLDDTGFGRLDMAGKTTLWDSLPLLKGLGAVTPVVPAEIETVEVEAEQEPEEVEALLEDRKTQLVHKVGRILGSL